MSGPMQKSLPDMMALSLSLSGVTSEPETQLRAPPAENLIPAELRDQFFFVIHHLLEGFVKSSDSRFKLPKNLTAAQKHYLLTVMYCMGLRVKFVRESEAYAVKTGNPVRFVRSILLSKASIGLMSKMVKLGDLSGTEGRIMDKLKILAFRAVGVLTGGIPRVPKKPLTNKYKVHRESLPVFSYRAKILDQINQNRITFIEGPGGCGKSTQVPQYILENAEHTKTPVRILVASPTNVSAVALCDRVAMEREELIGFTVGYQIPLESNSSPVETLLNFVSIHVFIRAMAMPGCKLLETTTHIIVDEVQCRTPYQDFLMLCLRDAIASRPHIKLIFLSEMYGTADLFEYFGGGRQCSRCVIDTVSHDVALFYVEDILCFSWGKDSRERVNYVGDIHEQQQQQEYSMNRERELSPDLLIARFRAVEENIESMWKNRNTESAFVDFWNLVRTGRMEVDYQHSKTAVTMLMAAAAAGHVTAVQILLDFGANTELRSANGFNAADWARVMKQNDVSRILEEREGNPNANSQSMAGSAERLVSEYLLRVESKQADLKLISRLIQMVHCTDTTLGTILVFVPSYEDIIELKEYIFSCFKRNPEDWQNQPFVLYFLHEHVQSGDQRAFFEKAKVGHRKVILSTSIGESCFTFQDVMFVIDSGKLPRSSQDAKTVCPANGRTDAGEECWISKAEADQRTARASYRENGVCYRLYTQKCYETMAPFPPPKISASQLLELCLQSRSLLRNDVRIWEFLKLLPCSPSVVKVQGAVQCLKLIGALHEDEQLSDLGIHLLEYNADPRWAKAVIYSVIFRCMDPILTIASCASYGQPFIIKNFAGERELAYRRRLEMSCGTASDHMALLKAFHKWETERSVRDTEGFENFCTQCCISPSSFDIVYGIRTHYLGQLRAAGFVRTKGQCDVKDLNKFSDNWALVKAVLTASLYPNVAVVDRVSNTLFDRETNEMYISKSSVIAVQNSEWTGGLRSDWIIYDEKYRNLDGDVEIKGCSVVNPTSVALFAGDLSAVPELKILSPTPIIHGTGFTFSRNERACVQEELPESGRCFNVDGWIRMFGFDPILSELGGLRDELRFIIKRHLRNPECIPSHMEDRMLEILVKLLVEEDARLGLKQANVGQWPKLVAGNLLSAPLTGFEVSLPNGYN